MRVDDELTRSGGTEGRVWRLSRKIACHVREIGTFSLEVTRTRVPSRRASSELLTLGFRRVEFSISVGATWITLHKTTKGTPTAQFNSFSRWAISR